MFPNSELLWCRNEYVDDYIYAICTRDLLRHSLLLIAEDADCIVNYQIVVLFTKVDRFIR